MTLGGVGEVLGWVFFQYHYYGWSHLDESQIMLEE